MKSAPCLLIDKAPPVFVSLKSTVVLPLAASSITALLLFWAISRPRGVATIPSALLPSTLHRVCQRTAPAITSLIALMEYSCAAPVGGLNPGGALKGEAG